MSILSIEEHCVGFEGSHSDGYEEKYSATSQKVAGSFPDEVIGFFS
jgi:hypothetical protein